MKNTKPETAVPRIVAVCAVALCLIVLSPAAFAAKANPGVLPVKSSPYGMTYGEWSAAHWQWLYSMPVDAHPLFDTADCSEGQEGQVWFLGGTFTAIEQDSVIIGEATRDCSIPAGKALFFPLVDVESSSLEGVGETEEELRADAKFWADLIVPESLFCEVDGTAVQNLADFRVLSPLFDVGPLPDNNVMGAPAGSTGITVGDGYFIMLAPLSVGTHTLHFGGMVDGSDLGFIFILDITYNITVEPVAQGPRWNALGELGAEWWQWVFSIAEPENPLLDETGEDAAVGQAGDLFFLCGSLGGAAERTVTIPEGKMLFFPLLNTVTDNVGATPHLGVPELYDWAIGQMDAATALYAELDGVPIEDLFDTRGTSRPFRYTLPRNDNLYQVLGLDVWGTVAPAVSDGYWVLLDPLSVGSHELNFGGTFEVPGWTFSVDIVYHITVE